MATMAQMPVWHRELWELTWGREHQEKSYCLASATIMETCLLVWPDLNFLKRKVGNLFLFCFVYIWGVPTLKRGQKLHILRTSSWARGIAQGQSTCLVFIHLDSVSLNQCHPMVTTL